MGLREGEELLVGGFEGTCAYFGKRFPECFACLGKQGVCLDGGFADGVQLGFGTDDAFPGPEQLHGEDGGQGKKQDDEAPGKKLKDE